ncbi:MAG TPA: RNA polymerase sigma factor [Candidatus Paceibacterota bacterium]|nr:RNA polymerase sigma factor [Candidatus Paceibacterota bacterium]
MSLRSEEKEKKFLESYDEYSDAIFRYCFFKVSDADLAKDLTQDTFTKVWQEIASGTQVDNMKAYLYRVATNLVIDYYRKKKTYSLDKLQEDGFDPIDQRNETILEDASEVRIVKSILQELDEKYREPVYLRYIEEMSPKEIAAVLELSENVVSVRIHRGLKQLQDRMKDT